MSNQASQKTNIDGKVYVMSKQLPQSIISRHDIVQISYDYRRDCVQIFISVTLTTGIMFRLKVTCKSQESVVKFHFDHSCNLEIHACIYRIYIYLCHSPFSISWEDEKRPRVCSSVHACTG